MGEDRVAMTASQEPTTQDKINTLADWISMDGAVGDTLQRSLDLCDEIAADLEKRDEMVRELEEALAQGQFCVRLLGNGILGDAGEYPSEWMPIACENLDAEKWADGKVYESAFILHLSWPEARVALKEAP